ncbi:hypothetical protein Ahy_B08g091655 isoform D [Arachis hypogaea]|uniref:Uncharacterized protein n=1 Tax=Arachis hypogaea TaxID=3818 RepID=A0A444Y2F5_ARAHY|nr:hypothetical protein Ahy_B08g091655 isoform D [Arachis hypogaea]
MQPFWQICKHSLPAMQEEEEDKYINLLQLKLLNYNTTSSFLASLQILLPCPCWYNYDAELCFHWHKLQLSHSWISYEQLDSDNYFFVGYHLQPRSVSLF